jgi:hypothetical protein
MLKAKTCEVGKLLVTDTVLLAQLLGK